jgi:arsenate reductase (glutaredoxin)
MSTSEITIFHNPNCSTSRKAIALVQAHGHTPKVVEYLKAGWTAEQLRGLFKAMGMTAREAMRAKGTPAAELGLLEPGVSDEQIIAAMVAHPILVERPIVSTAKGARLGRPVERVLEVLP